MAYDNFPRKEKKHLDSRPDYSLGKGLRIIEQNEINELAEKIAQMKTPEERVKAAKKILVLLPVLK